jgi:hypothetical protein
VCESNFCFGVVERFTACLDRLLCSTVCLDEEILNCQRREVNDGEETEVDSDDNMNHGGRHSQKTPI